MASDLSRNDTNNEDRRSIYTVSEKVVNQNPFASKPSGTVNLSINSDGRLEEKSRGTKITY